MPRVTVLLTCYNHRLYIEEALNSVRSQDYKDFEVLAIDDGSTDGTREWLSKQTDIRTIFNERNLGTYASLNVGLEHASGEFLAILNDDDVWKADKLERQIRLMDENPRVGLVHSGGFFIDGEGTPMEGNPLGFKFPTFGTGDLLLALVYENKIIASAALVRRECFDRVGHFDRTYFGSGDWQMWYRIAEEYLVGMVQEPCTLYRVHGANASHKLEKIWQDDQRLREWMLDRVDRLENRFSPAEVRQAVAFNWAALGTVRALNGYPAQAREAFKRSIASNPLRIKSYLRYGASYLPYALLRKTL